MATDILFGTLAIRNGFVNQEQLDQALEIQRMVRRDGVEVPIGEVLVEMEALNPRQVDAVLQGQKFMKARWRGMAVAKAALDNNLAPKAAVEAALEFQKDEFRKTKQILEVQDILAEQGAITRRDSARLARIDFRPQAN